MIQVQTILKVSDNSGVQTVRCIKVLGGFKKKYAKLGDVIVVSVQKIRNMSKRNSKIKKGDIFKALIIRTKIKYNKKNGLQFCFNENSVVLINKQENLLGTRVIGPLPKILRNIKFNKLISLSAGLI